MFTFVFQVLENFYFFRVLEILVFKYISKLSFYSSILNMARVTTRSLYKIDRLNDNNRFIDFTVFIAVRSTMGIRSTIVLIIRCSAAWSPGTGDTQYTRRAP